MKGAGACVRCALCNPGSEAYRRSLDERRAPRHVVVSVAKGRESISLYACMLNGRAEERCPVRIGIDAAVIEARRRLVAKGFEPAANRRVAERLRRGENPY